MCAFVLGERSFKSIQEVPNIALFTTKNYSTNQEHEIMRSVGSVRLLISTDTCKKKDVHTTVGHHLVAYNHLPDSTSSALGLCTSDRAWWPSTRFSLSHCRIRFFTASACSSLTYKIVITTINRIYDKRERQCLPYLSQHVIRVQKGNTNSISCNGY